jgi:hypothetical protein
MMPQLQLLPLADMDRFSGLRDRFSAHRTHFDVNDALLGLLLLALVVAAILLLGRFAARQDRSRTCNNPRKLFRSLCRAHGLDRASRKLLRRLARWQGLAQPARLFLEAERFDEANVSLELLSQLPQLHAMRDRLFATQELEQDAAERGQQPPAESASGASVPAEPTGAKLSGRVASVPASPANARQASANLAQASARSRAVESQSQN